LDIKLHIDSETAPLQTVVLGIGVDQGEQLDINPVSKMHIEKGTYPIEADIIAEIATVENALVNAGVEVLRPTNLTNTEQIFTRDIGFVIEDKFILANMLEAARQPEVKGIQWILDELDPESIIRLPAEARIEGGDVIVHGDDIFVGISKRTNWQGFYRLKTHFPNKRFHALELKVTDDPLTNILHLDCSFQPVGNDYALIYEDGFLVHPQAIYERFPQDKLIRISQEEMNRMFPNIFSISPDTVLVERGFKRLIDALNNREIQTISVDYAETSKLSGLLRCSTLPLYRK
jgi:N-dimethylarginine dimethylaminohydrolase